MGPENPLTKSSKNMPDLLRSKVTGTGIRVTNGYSGSRRISQKGDNDVNKYVRLDDTSGRNKQNDVQSVPLTVQNPGAFSSAVWKTKQWCIFWGSTNHLCQTASGERTSFHVDLYAQ